jgi:DNA polymerase III subunit beta
MLVFRLSGERLGPVRFTAPKTDLLAGVQAVAKAIPSSTTEPMLLDVLVEAEGSGLKLFATDNRISIRQSLGGDVTEDGSVAVPGALFNELLQSLSTTQAAEVKLESTDRHRVTIDCGSAQYEIGGHDPKGFPYVPPFEDGISFTIPCQDLRGMLRQICVVAGTGFAGQAFDEVLLEVVEGRLTMVATDSVRLAIRHWKPETGELPDLSAKVPIHALQELGKVLNSDGDTLVKVGEDAIAFHFGGTEFRARLSDKTFPNYKQILPSSSSMKSVLDTRAFGDALKGILPLAREMKQKVQLKFTEDELEILCVSPEIGRARRSIPVDLSGESLELAFNARFLLDYLGAAGADKVSFDATSSVHPAKLQPVGGDGDYVYILMPINL